MPRLSRPLSRNRPRKTRISTPSGWVNVTTQDGREVVECSGIQARALSVRHGFKLDGPGAHQGAPAPSAATAPPSAAEGPQAPPAAPEDPVPGSTVVYDGPLAILEGKVGDVMDRLDNIEGAGILKGAVVDELIAAETAGKGRKTILRRLGVDGA